MSRGKLLKSQFVRTTEELKPIIYYSGQLSFETMPFPKCLLPVRQRFIFIKMNHAIGAHYVLQQLARYVTQRYRPINACTNSVIKEHTSERDHSSGISPCQEIAGTDGQRLHLIQLQFPLELYEEARLLINTLSTFIQTHVIKRNGMVT